jgi:signal recognition particle receptor subunit alpha
VAVYQRALKLTYVEDLLDKANKTFSLRHKPDCYDNKDYQATFNKLLKDCEERAASGRRAPEGTPPPPPPPPRIQMAEGEEDEEAEEEQQPSSLLEDSKNQGEMNGHNSDDDQNIDITDSVAAFNTDAISKKFAKKGGSKAAAGTTTTTTATATATATAAAKKEPTAKTKKKGKAARDWSDLDGISGGGKINNGKNNEALDYTDGLAGDISALSASEMTQPSLIDAGDDADLDSDAESDAESIERGPGLLSSFVRSIGVNVVGTGALKKEDIAPALAELKKKLMERNVAEEIAEKLTESVAASLEGKNLGSFTRVTTAVRTAVEEALTRILTPQRSIDVLREVRASKGRGRPYTVVFVGVNGVGKSTNLAKVAYWLIQNGASVMIAACDTFRSGAVEQLKTHCARLNIPLFEKGYEKDPAKVAYEASKAAARNNIDVLLVDTAGRMQDNEPLMRALSSLINMNTPDLVLFVGEALVGNDAVDQLTKFNRRLADLAPDPNSKRLIDGIVLTKFDTIDDKVGAALSMVYTSGAPIMFVGCGQTYVDLKRLNVKSVVHSLLK